MKRLAQPVLFVGLLFAAMTIAAQGRPIMLVYPELPEPERGVFKLVRDGIESGAAHRDIAVVSLEIDSSTTASDIEARVRAEAPQSVIALGRQAFELTGSLGPKVPRVVGGVDLPVGAQSPAGISLVPDPRIVLEWLREAAPRIDRVAIVMDADHGWLQKPAEQAARSMGLQLQFYRADSVGEAATHYLNICRYGNPKTDAIWLLESGHFVTPDTLPTIIEESWSRSLDRKSVV